MCGLTSIFAYGAGAPPVDCDALHRSMDAMSSRGPDGSGTWVSVDRTIGFGHRRLAIIDLSPSGAQPMTTSDGLLRVVLNGEIYNYQELRRDLQQSGHQFASNSDTEVLLLLYRKYGENMVSQLRGMYAFALWDTSKGSLLLARDPFGIKPLYYADDGATIRIASQVKALLAGGGIDDAPSPAGHVGFLLWGHVPEPYTLYERIRAVPAGSTLTIDRNGRKTSRQFFDLTAECASAGEAGRNNGHRDARDRLHHALRESVERHMIADVPVGVFLSAGLDSTTIAGIASEMSGSPLRTVTLGFSEYAGTDNDETQLANVVARHYATDHQTRWVSKESFRNEREKLFAAMDQPTVDGVNSYFVSQAASAAGLKVALSGLGGDELFGGYTTFRDIPRVAATLAPFRFVPSIGRGFRYVSSRFLRGQTSAKIASLLEYGGSYEGAYLLRRGLYMPWELPSLMDGEMARIGWNELQTMSSLRASIHGVGNAHLRVAALESKWYMRNQLLRDADWASMAHSLEVRVPLVDLDLFREVAPMFNSRRPPTKVDMAQAVGRGLPVEVLARRKTGFSIPTFEWFSQANHENDDGRGLKGWAQHLIAEFAARPIPART